MRDCCIHKIVSAAVLFLFGYESELICLILDCLYSITKKNGMKQ